MKRIGAIVCLAALIVTMTASVCFGAQSLELVDNYPDDGQKNTTKDNMCVKLWFNNDMDSEKLEKVNKDCFTITDPKGKKIPIKVFYNNPKDKKQIMVLADTNKINTAKDIKDNTEYTLTISGKLQDKAGNTLGEDQKISFTTLNQGQSTKVYMIMMVIMMGGMFFFTSRQMKKQTAKQQEEGKVREEPFNPYKEAKKTGKSVDEVIAIHEKEMAKKAAKEAKKISRQKDVDDDDYEEDDNGNYKVKGPKPVSAGGSSYITGRKAIAEAKKAEEERLEKRRAANAKKKKKK
ncbi:Ig-like domain-containing protein [Emergencia sp.]|uniref:Ig-like domain-containing protein n=1 Tax=Emergencia sp. TaxID=1926557 RepID=UPI003AEFAF6E